MSIYYSYLLSSLLLITLTNSSSLRHLLRSPSKWSFDRRNSFIDISTSEPVLSRRRPVLPSGDRYRRWLDNDEVEIPIEDSTIIEVSSPLLPQDTTEINQTIEENSQNNTEQSTETLFPSTIISETSTVAEITYSNVTDVNQSATIDNLTTIETIHNETETSINPTIEKTTANPTISQTETPTDTTFSQDTAIIIFDFATRPPLTAGEDETTILSEYNTTIIDEDTNTTITSNVVQTDTVATQKETDNPTTISDVATTISLDVIQNETSTMINEEDEYSNETMSVLPKPTAKPVCDRACQCLKECPYGYEIQNNTCKCHPPCKNYQCFGNDTCIVTKKGQPICRPENGSEHDRPTRCYQPADAGYHDNDMRYHNRWYYDPDQDTCHLFVYRGLGGNENNFQTLHECHLECITCAPSSNPGTCLGYMSMWYYDNKKKQCSQFRYTGCGGNENRFLRKQECVDTCVTRTLNL